MSDQVQVSWTSHDISFSNRRRVCHFTSEHRHHLWIHKRASGPHPARVRAVFLYPLCLTTALQTDHQKLRVSRACLLISAYRLTTQRTAWHGISWLRGSWMLQEQERSCTLLKAEPLTSTGERSAAVRSTRRGSRASTLVGSHSY